MSMYRSGFTGGDLRGTVIKSRLRKEDLLSSVLIYYFILEMAQIDLLRSHWFKIIYDRGLNEGCHEGCHES